MHLQQATPSGGAPVGSSTAAFTFSRRQLLLLSFVLLPIPLCAMTGLALPLPEIVQRVAASLAPGGTDRLTGADERVHGAVRLIAPEAPAPTPATVARFARTDTGARTSTVRSARVNRGTPRRAGTVGEAASSTPTATATLAAPAADPAGSTAADAQRTGGTATSPENGSTMAASAPTAKSSPSIQTTVAAGSGNGSVSSEVRVGDSDVSVGVNVGGEDRGVSTEVAVGNGAVSVGAQVGSGAESTRVDVAVGAGGTSVTTGVGSSGSAGTTVSVGASAAGTTVDVGVTVPPVSVPGLLGGQESQPGSAPQGGGAAPGLGINIGGLGTR